MRILVNYNNSEKSYTTILAHFLRKAGLTAISTARTYSPGELVALAKDNKCAAILLINTDTLKKCVPGSPTLDKYRGSRLNFSVPVIVTNSLAHTMTIPHGSWLLEKDLEKFKHINTKPHHFAYTTLETEKQMMEAYSFLEHSIVIAHDIETALLNEEESKDDDNPVIAGGDSIITSCSWSAIDSAGSIRTWVLPFVNFGIDYWQTDSDYIKAIAFMQKVNSLPIPKVMHNGPYDSTHLIRYHAEPNNYCLDTMGLAHSEFSELPKTLDFVASYHLFDYVYWKDDSDEAAKQKDVRKQLAYNAKDTWYTLRILLSQLKNSPAYAINNYKTSFKLIYPSLYCAFEGFKIDQDTRIELRKDSRAKLISARVKLREYFADGEFNPGSWQQVEKYIYKVFGAIKPKIGKSKSCTDEKNLLAVAEQHPLLALLTNEILEYRGAQKAIGTYFDFRQLAGRLLWNLNPFGTDSDRMSCNASSLWVGTQVQNIPKYAKDMLIADEGYTLIEIDNKQSEARCTAYCAQDLALIAALEDVRYDFYKTLGTLFFSIPYEDVTEFFRDKVLKKIVHGTNYMMGARTFVENITVRVLHQAALVLGLKLVNKPKKGELSILNFAASLLDKYHEPFPRIRIWYLEIKKEIRLTGFLVSPLGQVRRFFGSIEKDHNMLRSAVAHQPQNLSVAILNIGFWKIYKQLVQPSKGVFRLKAQIHDSVIAQVKDEYLEEYLKRMQALMDNPIIVHGRTLRIPTDTKVGKVWAKMEKKK